MSRTKKTLMDKFKQDSSPSPVSYKTETADVLTRKRSIAAGISKYTKIDDMHSANLKRKKGVPGVGHYSIEKADKHVSMHAPLFRKGRR